jgi:hypothetical protein
MKATRYFSSYIDAYNYYPNGVPSTEIAIVGDSSYILVSSDNTYNGGTTAFFDAGMTNDQIVDTMVDTAYVNGTTYGYSYGYPLGYTDGTTYGEAIGYATGHAAGYEEGYAYGYTEGETAGSGVDKDYLCIEFFDGDSDTLLTNRATTLLLEANSQNPEQQFVSYSFDKSTWTDITFTEANEYKYVITTSTDNGNKVYLKGHITEENVYGFYLGYTNDTANVDYMKISGNIVSLIDPEDFDTSNLFHISLFMFHNRVLKDASNMILPDSNLGYYNEMFRHCSTLEKAPNLIETNLVQGCYEGMFSNSKITQSIRFLEDGQESWGNTYYQNMYSGCTYMKYIPYTAYNIDFNQWALPSYVTVVKNTNASVTNLSNAIIYNYNPTTQSDLWSDDPEEFMLNVMSYSILNS